MGRIINNRKISEITQFSDVEKELIHEIISGKYVLVLGPDVILKDEYSNGNSIEYLDELFRNWSYEEGKFYSDENARKRGIRDFGQKYSCYDNDETKELNDISPDVEELINKGFFKFIITTAYDEYLECLMKKIYSQDELKVLNIYSDVDKNVVIREDEYGKIKPILFYAFGKLNSNYDFAYSDTDKLELLSRWLQKTNRWENLFNYLRNKKILAVGCKYDDWFFRFFWYCLRQNIEKGKMCEGDVAISLNIENSESDRKLKEYLECIQVKMHGNARDFIKHLNTKLTDEYAYKMISDSMNNRENIFISYATEDFFTVYQICTILLREGYNVWMDNEKLRGGDGYEERIKDAISQCKVFLPILSAQVKKDLQNGNKRYYKDTEWEQIKDNKKAKIIPITIFGFDIRQDRELLPEILKNTSSVDWTKEGEKHLLNSLK